MLTEVTSLADYLNKVKQEKRYQRAVIKAYKYNYGETVSYKKAFGWIDDWVRKNVANRKDDRTCFAMSDFLNRFIRELNEHEKVLANRRAARAGVPPAVTDPTLGIAMAPLPLP
jgi:deoxyhypusine synthase